MAIPTNYIKKRDLLYSEKSQPKLLSQIGREFLALERFSDALDFFEKARDSDGVQEIKQIALKIGDTFLLARLERFDRALINKTDWDAAAKKAEEAGRPSMTAFIARKFAPPPGAASAAVAPGHLPGEEPLAEV